MRIITSGLFASIAALGLASAQTFPDADTIVIEDVFGTVTVELDGSGAIHVATSGPGAGSLSIGGGDEVTIRGERIDRRAWRRRYNGLRRREGGRQASGEDPAFLTMLEDRPVIAISAPEGTAIRIADSAIRLTAEGTAGAVRVADNVHLLVSMGDIAEGELSVDGSGYLAVGNVAGRLDAGVHGSGDLVAGDTGDASLAIHGSGDLAVGDVRGRFMAAVHGSGDIEVQEVEGHAEAMVHGSGDVSIARVAGRFEGTIHGSGDLSVGAVEGSNLEASIHGSGDIEIDGGRVEALAVAIYGSGDVDFRGTAKDAELRTEGSGGIDVAEVTGNIAASGDDIRVNGRNAGDPD